MASFLTTIKFIIFYLWVVAKQTLVLITTSWVLYLVDMNEDFRGFFSANLFAINAILIYLLYMKDKHLEVNGFYLLYNIYPTRVFLAKLTLLGIAFIVHFSLYLVVTIKINFHLFITLISIILIAFLSKLIFFNVSRKWGSIGYFLILAIVFFIGYNISDGVTTLIMFCFLLVCLFLTIRDLIKIPIN